MVIFCHGRLVARFAKLILPQLKHKFILISHNSDTSKPNASDPLQMNLLEDNRLIRWFAQNPSIVHSKLEPIPIGLVSRIKGMSGVQERLSKHLQ